MGVGGVESEANVTEIHEALHLDEMEGTPEGYHGHFGIYSIRWSGDGREVVAGTGDSSILIYDMEKQKVRKGIDKRAKLQHGGEHALLLHNPPSVDLHKSTRVKHASYNCLYSCLSMLPEARLMKSCLADDAAHQGAQRRCECGGLSGRGLQHSALRQRRPPRPGALPIESMC